jgi:hypothetical protein
MEKPMNHEPYHESPDYMTPADVYIGQAVKTIEERQRIKGRTIKLRKRNCKRPIA